MNGSKAGTVSSSHVLVERLHRVRSAHLAVLLVHVVCAGSRIVPDPDAEVFDLCRPLLSDLRLHFGQPENSASHHETYRMDIQTRTLFKLTISPFAFLIFRSLARKYQNRDFATTSLGAKMRMR